MGKTVMGAVVSLGGFIADFMRSQYRGMAAVVIGRRLFDLTNGWNGKPAAGEHVFVVTHQPPTDWEHADTPGAQARADRPGGRVSAAR
jgi:dihydrofolate reductase